MARELTILLRVKNAMQIGLAKGYASLQQFGKSAMRIGKFFATSFLAAGASIAGFAAKALSSYAESETAQNSMAAAFRAFGEEVDVNTARVLASAKAIQSETGVSDEAVVSMAARLRMLGVQSSKLDEATRATIGLKAAGMEEEAAAKALALAYSGNYTQLGRYIPALRNANTESEKAAILADFVARGYSQQQAKLETVAGQWGLLKERVGDVWEEVGRAIEQNGELTKAMARAGVAMKEFGEDVAAWVNGGGVANLMAGTKMFFEDMRFRFMMLSNISNITFGAILDRWTYTIRRKQAVLTAYANVFLSYFRLFKETAASAWDLVKNPFSKFDPPDLKPVISSIGNLIKAYNPLNQVTSQFTKEAIEYRTQLEMDHYKTIKELSEQQLQSLAQYHGAKASMESTAAAASVAVAVDADDSVTESASLREAELTALTASRAAREAEAAGKIVDANQGASEAVKGIWQDNLKSFSQIEATKVAVAQGAAAAISGMSGGTIETSDKFRIAKLRAAGIDPNMANGSVLTTQQSKALDNVTQTQILAELQKMNAKQDKLLTFG